jgi:hypothetical protein
MTGDAWTVPLFAKLAALAGGAADRFGRAGLFVALAGVLIAVLDRRAHRPAMAVLAAPAAALLADSVLPVAGVTPARPLLILAAMLGAFLGLVAPRGGAALLLTSLGHAAGHLLEGFFPGSEELVWLSGALIGLLLAWTGHESFVDPLIRLAASLLIAVGGWLYLLVAFPRGVWSTPVVWMGVLAIVQISLGNLASVRAERRRKPDAKAARKAEQKSEEQREAELRRRYARYYE